MQQRGCNVRQDCQEHIGDHVEELVAKRPARAALLDRRVDRLQDVARHDQWGHANARYAA